MGINGAQYGTGLRFGGCLPRAIGCRHLGRRRPAGRAGRRARRRSDRFAYSPPVRLSLESRYRSSPSQRRENRTRGVPRPHVAHHGAQFCARRRRVDADQRGDAKSTSPRAIRGAGRWGREFACLHRSHLRRALSLRRSRILLDSDPYGWLLHSALAGHPLRPAPGWADGLGDEQHCRQSHRAAPHTDSHHSDARPGVADVAERAGRILRHTLRDLADGDDCHPCPRKHDMVACHAVASHRPAAKKDRRQAPQTHRRARTPRGRSHHGSRSGKQGTRGVLLQRRPRPAGAAAGNGRLFAPPRRGAWGDSPLRRATLRRDRAADRHTNGADG